MTTDWDTVLADFDARLGAAKASSRWSDYAALYELFREHGDALLSAALRERESANEVERLRGALKRILLDGATGCPSYGHAERIATQALAAEKGEQT